LNGSTIQLKLQDTRDIVSEDSFQNTNEMSLTYNDLEEENIPQMGERRIFFDEKS
jgi:hypothetical protein